MKTMNKKEVYNLKEVCELLGLSPDRIYEYLREGFIRGYQIKEGSKWLIPRVEIDKLTGKTNEEVEEEFKKEKKGKENLLPLQQVEHIKELQEFAKSVIESCPIFYPGFDSPKEIELFHDAYFSLYKLFNDLVHHTYWLSLAAHLSDGGKQIECMAAEMTIESTCMPWEKPVPVSLELKTRVRTALNLINAGDLAVVANYGDTKEWERRGLKPTCPFCPIKTLQTQT